MVRHRYLATCPTGVGIYLAQELAQLGAEAVVEMPSGVSFEGGLSLAYRVCLWSRLANRVLLQLGTTQADSADSLYEAASGVDWGAHIPPSGSLAVDFSGRSSGVRNEQFGAQRLKDAIVDQFRTKGLSRPTVDLKAPDVRVHARLHKGALSLAIDLSGDSLHRRGYRLDGGLAPLKENIAAAALWAAGWSSERAQEEALIDPMCGSSTLLLEGALMALDALCHPLVIGLKLVALPLTALALFLAPSLLLSGVAFTLAAGALYALIYLRSDRSPRALFALAWAAYATLALPWVQPWATLTVRSNRWLTRGPNVKSWLTPYAESNTTRASLLRGGAAR